MVELLNDLGWLGYLLAPIAASFAFLVIPILWILIISGPFWLYMVYTEIMNLIKEEDNDEKNKATIRLLLFSALSLPLIFYIL